MHWCADRKSYIQGRPMSRKSVLCHLVREWGSYSIYIIIVVIQT